MSLLASPWCAVLAGCLLACTPSSRGQRPTPPPPEAPPPPPPSGLPARGPAAETPQRESRHLRHVRQLTQDGTRNLEAYFSPDARRLVFQSQRAEGPGYRIVVMDADGRNPQAVSPPGGSAVCPSFAPDRPRLLFASTHLATAATDDADLDLFEADLDGQHATRLTDARGYDAEASFSPDGQKVVFTSTRDGDPELYVLDRTLAAITRLTHAPGSDGAAFFSPDGTQLVFRSFRAGDGTADLYRLAVDGTHEEQLTDLHAVAWSPFFHPNGRQVIFAADLKPNAFTSGHNHDLYLLDLATGGLERITYADGFDGLPAFSPDGRHLVWTSARQGGALQIFLAEWVD